MNAPHDFHLRVQPRPVPAALLEALGEDVALRSGMLPPELSAQSLALLEAQPWRGNIRELRNVFEAMFALSDGELIDAAQLPPAISRVMAEQAEGLGEAPAAEGMGRLEQVERQAVLDAIAGARGNMSLAARTLGISRSTLYVKLAAIRAREAKHWTRSVT